MTRCRIILQARTTSHRLPAKVLLPVGGLPLALLCAHRLASCGHPVLLATSTDPSDDVLASLAADCGLPTHRGSLDNVADRFLEASSDLHDDDLVVRATADNPVPDGSIVEAVLNDFGRFGGDYLGPRHYRRDLPIGLAVEVFRLGSFRRSLAGGYGSNVAEHVTPLLASGPSVLESPSFDSEGIMAPVRMTVDTFEDYLIAARAFRDQQSGRDAAWQDVAASFVLLRGVSASARA